MALPDTIPHTSWRAFENDGYARIGRLESSERAELADAIDRLMLGTATVAYDRLLMQLDSVAGEYAELGPQTKGFKGATLRYRKIQDLEHYRPFRQYAERDVFRNACAAIYGRGAPIACLRAMFMNKPADGGTDLPWHQDRWAALDRDPLLTVWTAIDAADETNGALEVIPGSHRQGVINPSHASAFLDSDQRRHADEQGSVVLEVEAGEVLLLHNWLVHKSGVNRTRQPRRAFSVCYMDARTQSTAGEQFTALFEQAT